MLCEVLVLNSGLIMFSHVHTSINQWWKSVILEKSQIQFEAAKFKIRSDREFEY